MDYLPCVGVCIDFAVWRDYVPSSIECAHRSPGHNSHSSQYFYYNIYGMFPRLGMMLSAWVGDVNVHVNFSLSVRFWGRRDMLTKSDRPSHRPSFHRLNVRQQRPQAILHPMLHHLHNCQHRPRPANKLHSPPDSPHGASRRLHSRHRPLFRCRSRSCDVCRAREIHGLRRRWHPHGSRFWAYDWRAAGTISGVAVNLLVPGYFLGRASRAVCVFLP